MVLAKEKKFAQNAARNDDIVTARVPKAIKEQGNAVLRKIGSTPTELVNAAYAYVLQHDELPKTVPSLEDLTNARRTLSEEQRAHIKNVVSRLRFQCLLHFGRVAQTRSALPR